MKRYLRFMRFLFNNIIIIIILLLLWILINACREIR